MGDDRHGQAPRPGDRAPWERYPTAEYTERDGSNTSRRARHTDTTAESGSTPLTVQDLVQKVDKERGGRRRRAEGGARPARRAETAPAHPAERAQRAPESAPRPAGPAARPAESSARAADPPPRPGERTARPASPSQRPEQATKAMPQTPGRKPGNPPATTAGDTARPPTARQRTATRSAVVDDIAGTPATGLPTPKKKPRRPEKPEEVTDVMAPLDTAGESKRPGKSWPTTGKSKAAPKAVGSPSLSRLAASKQRRTRRLRTSGRIGASALAVLILLITGGGWSYLRSTNNSLTQVSALDDKSSDIVDSAAQLGDENYLLVGTDTRAGANSQLGAGTLADAEGSRADTTMLVHIPKARNRVVIVSFPRDLDVTRPQCAGWDNNNKDPQYTKELFPSAIGEKLNAVYNLGGPKCLVSTIQRLTGVSINHFIAVDFAGFEAMVDQLDGVEVCATKPIVDGVLGTVLEKGGKQRIDGATALNYVRARHVYGEERSDYDRINRQQRFMASLLRGALSSKVLFDPGKLNGFVDAFAKHTMVANVAPNDLLTLGRSLQKLDAGTVTFITIPTAGTTSYGNEIPRETDIKAIFSAIRDDRPLPGEKPVAAAPAPTTSAPPTPPSYTAVDPNTVSLLVSNGSDVQGRALQVSNKLGNQGFNIYNIGTFQGGSLTTKVRFAPGSEAEAATVATAIPGASLEADSTLDGIIEVVLGKDFTGTVRTPIPVGDPITNVPTISTTNATTVALPSDLEHINAADETCQ
ncbi:LCP family glycopolymer transferase [Nocardia goodfellowii]|uniref:LCP family protein required for cell wall assembly n=1 Tax=Nocardia goodfellowii TaxID=882446 RepID=A0ABS4Q928_9NOCA|nr:LCP family protein [Nocardia goodfellowii]MBP2187614.1 LCP family protein required for cell wall assembly [Nocardia goodfellowii]